MALKQLSEVQATSPAALLPVSVIVAARNEVHNLARCLESLRGVGEVYVIDSGSTDATVEIARAHQAKVVQFHYQGGWPKKRQWAMDTLPLAYDWVFLVDADEALTPELADEIKQALQNPRFDGYYVALQMYFLGRRLRHCGANFYSFHCSGAARALTNVACAIKILRCATWKSTSTSWFKARLAGFSIR